MSIQIFKSLCQGKSVFYWFYLAVADESSTLGYEPRLTLRNVHSYGLRPFSQKSGKQWALQLNEDCFFITHKEIMW